MQNLPKFAAYSAALADHLCKICKEIRKISSISDSSNAVTNPSGVTNVPIFLRENIRKNNQSAPSVQNWSHAQNLQRVLCERSHPSVLALFTQRKRGRTCPAIYVDLQSEHQNLQIGLQIRKPSCKTAQVLLRDTPAQ